MLYLIFAAMAVVADQLLKYWVVNNIELYAIYDLFPGIIHLTQVHNYGAAFSMFEGGRWIFVGLTAVCVVLIVIFIFKSNVGPVGKLSIAGILGGAVANCIDRVLNGYVVDMFEVEFIEFAVFNVADCFIVVGAVIFFFSYLIYTIKSEKKSKKRSEPEKSSQDNGDAILKHGSIHTATMLDPSDNSLSETRILEEFDFERRMSEGIDSDN